MLDFRENAPPGGGLNTQIVARLYANLAFVDADDDRVREVMGSHFKAYAVRTDTEQMRAALVAERAALQRQIRADEAAHRGMAPTVTTLSSEPIAKPHWFKRLSGGVLGLVGVAALAPIPFVVASGIYESDAIEAVVEWPAAGLLYGIAPLAGGLALHELRNCFTSDRLRRVFDIAIYSSAVLSLGYWAQLFGPTFLENAGGSFGAAAKAGASLSDFYMAQLILEFTSGAAAITAASSLLTSGAKTVTVSNEARDVLGDGISELRIRDRDLATRLDELNAQDAVYADALTEFQDRAVLHVEAAKKLLAAKAATEVERALAEVRDALMTSITTGGSHE